MQRSLDTPFVLLDLSTVYKEGGHLATQLMCLNSLRKHGHRISCAAKPDQYHAAKCLHVYKSRLSIGDALKQIGLAPVVTDAPAPSTRGQHSVLELFQFPALEAVLVSDQVNECDVEELDENGRPEGTRTHRVYRAVITNIFTFVSYKWRRNIRIDVEEV
ncbi:unnamed protein product [Cylicocyclus nassatus]|uniref:Uncharacterized protein n=1 Tax=Cylicocyclus nassatus TaxID=53992 RepID=A0AA36M211_CYLNA|nr:unnamed protein product [Cylicocyclus nassatus]